MVILHSALDFVPMLCTLEIGVRLKKNIFFLVSLANKLWEWQLFCYHYLSSKGVAFIVSTVYWEHIYSIMYFVLSLVSLFCIKSLRAVNRSLYTYQ